MYAGEMIFILIAMMFAAGAGAGIASGGLSAQLFGEHTSFLFWLAIFALVCGICWMNLKEQDLHRQNNTFISYYNDPWWRRFCPSRRFNAMGLGGIPYIGHHPASIYLHGSYHRLS